MRNRTKYACYGFGMLVALAAATAAFAQSYPTKTIRLVIPYNAGGATDLTARPIARELTQLWGQSVVVDNRPGASGMIGANAVAQSRPDGYTVLVSASMEVAADVVVYKNMQYDPVKDLQPVTLASVSPLVRSFSGRSASARSSGTERQSHEGTLLSSTFLSFFGTPALRKYFCARMSAATWLQCSGTLNSSRRKTTEPSGFLISEVALRKAMRS